MRLHNKSSSMPTLSQPISDNPVSAKPRKQHLQELQNQVNKSRIAIENMSHTRAIQGNLYNQVEELQKELHLCILSLSRQSQKQKVLQQLNNVLKGQMSEVQAVQRTSDQFVSCGIEKKIKKVQYDIKQILHKYNQEIAKINWLKEQANASRDERVVYSNLFNKIEKEIKHYEENYKQSLIKNQIFLDQKRTPSIKKDQEMTPIDQIQQIEQSTDKGKTIQFTQMQTRTDSSKKDIKPKEQNKIIKIYQKTTEVQTFMTNPKDIAHKNQTHSTPKDQTSSTRKNLHHSRGIQGIIRERERTIKAVIVKMQCRTLDEVKKLYTSLDSQNENLGGQICQLDEHISYLQEEIDIILSQKRSSGVYQNRQLTEMVKISKKSRSNKHIVNNFTSPHVQPVKEITRQICDLLGIESQNLVDDVLRQIDRKIEDLGFTIIRKNQRRESRVVSRDDNSDRVICQLLEKIDKFGQSEKIFDKPMLRSEYHKELSKARKKAKKSN